MSFSWKHYVFHLLIFLSNMLVLRKGDSEAGETGLPALPARAALGTIGHLVEISKSRLLKGKQKKENGIIWLLLEEASLVTSLCHAIAVT